MKAIWQETSFFDRASSLLIVLFLYETKRTTLQLYRKEKEGKKSQAKNWTEASKDCGLVRACDTVHGIESGTVRQGTGQVLVFLGVLFFTFPSLHPSIPSKASCKQKQKQRPANTVREKN